MFPKTEQKCQKFGFLDLRKIGNSVSSKSLVRRLEKEHERFRLPAYSVSNKAGLISQTEQFDGSRLDDLEKQIINSLNQMNSPIIQQE